MAWLNITIDNVFNNWTFFSTVVRDSKSESDGMKSESDAMIKQLYLGILVAGLFAVGIVLILDVIFKR